MKLQASGISGNRLSFVSQALGGQTVRIWLDDDGMVSTLVQTDIAIDGDDNRIKPIVVPGENGQPDQHFYTWTGKVPAQYAHLAVKVKGKDVVLAAHVVGAQMVSETVELTDEVAQDLLADTSFGPNFRVVGEDDGEEE